jgi:hypothetical protein
VEGGADNNISNDSKVTHHLTVRWVHNFGIALGVPFNRASVPCIAARPLDFLTEQANLPDGSNAID